MWMWWQHRTGGRKGGGWIKQQEYQTVPACNGICSCGAGACCSGRGRQLFVTQGIDRHGVQDQNSLDNWTPLHPINLTTAHHPSTTGGMDAVEPRPRWHQPPPPRPPERLPPPPPPAREEAALRLQQHLCTVQHAAHTSPCHCQPRQHHSCSAQAAPLQSATATPCCWCCC